MQLLFEKSTFGHIQGAVASLREGKGKEKETLSLIERALRFGQGVVVNLLWERILVYQHLVMQGNKKALPKMEAATLAAGKYVKQNKLKEWESRSLRFLGRLYDYKGKFSESVKAYKKAIPLARLDPDFVKKGYPRWLELEGFLSSALIKSGKVNEGVNLAKKTFEKFNQSSEGKFLKKKDYYTWAIWKSGIAIRTIEATHSKRFLSWLAEVGKDLNPPKGVKIWGDFSLRRDEIATLKRRVQNIN
ncbi:MAG: tetratricopeptide repeat protein [Patescibacteria group bacterium]